MKKLLILIVFMGCSLVSLAQANLREKHYLYDLDADVRFEHQLVVAGHKGAMYFKVSLKDNNSIGQYVIRYTYYSIINESTSTSTDTLKIRNSLIAIDKNDYYFKVNIPFEKEVNLIEFSMNDVSSSRNYQFFVPVITQSTFTPADIILMEKDRDVPLFKKFLTEQDTFRVVAPFSRPKKAYFFHYKDSFKPATPPFVMKPAEGASELEIDSSFSVPINEPVSISRTGMFYVQTDTSRLNGISMNITDKFYPKTAQVSKLIDRIIYISTAKEYRLLQEAGTKKAFDTYWMAITKSQERAIRIIGNYYNRVTEANMLFSEYKEGWMTDKGMIYIIYGPPNQVVMELNTETWVYQKTPNLSKIKFSFVRLKNIFTNQHMVLMRDEEYSQSWFRTIDLWRRGIQVN